MMTHLTKSYRRFMLFRRHSRFVFALLLLTSPGFSAVGDFSPKPLDGVRIEAVELSPNRSNHEISLGVGLYPFNAYYNALTINANYQHNLDRFWSWEIASIQSAFAFDKGLTTELAERFNVNPERIDRLRLTLSSQMFYTLAHGKVVLTQDHIRYFRLSASGGLGLVSTSQSNGAALTLGVRIEAVSSESFSWRLDIRDAFVFSGFNQYVTFTIGSAFGF